MLQPKFRQKALCYVPQPLRARLYALLQKIRGQGFIHQLGCRVRRRLSRAMRSLLSVTAIIENRLLIADEHFTPQIFSMTSFTSRRARRPSITTRLSQFLCVTSMYRHQHAAEISNAAQGPESIHFSINGAEAFRKQMVIAA